MSLGLLPKAALFTAVALLVFAIELLVGTAFVPGSAERGIEGLCEWDCVYYRSIAEQGYRLGPDDEPLEVTFGFFPGFPLAVLGVMTVTGLGFAYAALLLNAVYLLLFVWLALSSREELLLRSDRDMTLFLVAFILTPWSVYNRVPYTEMQFNLAMLATFVAWRRGHFAAAALCGVALSATRVTGAFLPMALLIELVSRERWRVIDLLKAPDNRFRALAVMPLGGIAFFVFLAFHLGDPLANFRVQGFNWGHNIGNPVENLIGGIATMTYAGLSAALAFGITGIAMVLGAMWGRVPVPLALMVLGIIGTTILSSPHGLTRYAWAIFPVYLMVPTLPPLVRWPLFALLIGLQVAIVILWLSPGHGLA